MVFEYKRYCKRCGNYEAHQTPKSIICINCVKKTAEKRKGKKLKPRLNAEKQKKQLDIIKLKLDKIKWLNK